MNTIVSAAPAAKAFVSELTPVPLQPPARCTPQTLLALDLGKFKSVACVMTVATNEHRFVTIESTPSAVHDLLVELMPDRLVIEACSISGWVCDVARTLNVPVEVANTQGEAWNWRRVKRKTDRVDALKLARMSLMHQIDPVHIPEPKVRQWRGLIQYRHGLVDRRTKIKNTPSTMLRAGDPQFARQPGDDDAAQGAGVDEAGGEGTGRAGQAAFRL